MKQYILSIAGMVLISAVIAIICPNGKMGKFVKGTTRLFLLVVMLSPMIGWMQGKFPDVSPSDDFAEQAAYLEKCADLLESRDEEEISAMISERFALSSEVDVVRDTSANFPLQKIIVKLDLSGISEEAGRINMMSRVKEAVAENFKTEVEVYDGRSE